MTDSVVPWQGLRLLFIFLEWCLINDITEIRQKKKGRRRGNRTGEKEKESIGEKKRKNGGSGGEN